MKVKKLNRTHNVFKDGNAKWELRFVTASAYSFAILKLAQAFGMGMPYQNKAAADKGHPWMFRNGDSYEWNPHIIYITTEEQLTFCQLSFGVDH